jgi:hypothetical protein
VKRLLLVGLSVGLVGAVLSSALPEILRRVALDHAAGRVELTVVAGEE